jgi:hypothetical protein
MSDPKDTAKRSRYNRTAHTYRFSEDCLEYLNKLSSLKGQSHTAILEEAVRELYWKYEERIERYFKKPE